MGKGPIRHKKILGLFIRVGCRDTPAHDDAILFHVTRELCAAYAGRFTSAGIEIFQSKNQLPFKNCITMYLRAVKAAWRRQRPAVQPQAW